MSRWKAAAIHLALSAAVTTGATALLILAWFPPPHFAAGGGLRLMRTILLVDVVLGPLLTLIVYRTGKKGLRFDLAVIGTLQAAALLYGLVVAHGARPVYIVVSRDRATLVRAGEVHLQPAPTAYRRPPFYGIDVVTLRGLSRIERSPLVEEIMEGKPDIDYRPAFYLPLRGHAIDIARHAPTLERRMRAEPRHAACYRRWLSHQPASDLVGLRVLPMLGAETEAEVVIDSRAGTLVGYLPKASELASDCTQASPE